MKKLKEIPQEIKDKYSIDVKPSGTFIHNNDSGVIGIMGNYEIEETDTCIYLKKPGGEINLFKNVNHIITIFYL